MANTSTTVTKNSTDTLDWSGVTLEDWEEAIALANESHPDSSFEPAYWN